MSFKEAMRSFEAADVELAASKSATAARQERLSTIDARMAEEAAYTAVFGNHDAYSNHTPEDAAQLALQPESGTLFAQKYQQQVDSSDPDLFTPEEIAQRVARYRQSYIKDIIGLTGENGEGEYTIAQAKLIVDASHDYERKVAALTATLQESGVPEADARTKAYARYDKLLARDMELIKDQAIYTVEDLAAAKAGKHAKRTVAHPVAVPASSPTPKVDTPPVADAVVGADEQAQAPSTDTVEQSEEDTTDNLRIDDPATDVLPRRDEADVVVQVAGGGEASEALGQEPETALPEPEKKRGFKDRIRRMLGRTATTSESTKEKTPRRRRLLKGLGVAALATLTGGLMWIGLQDTTNNSTESEKTAEPTASAEATPGADATNQASATETRPIPAGAINPETSEGRAPAGEVTVGTASSTLVEIPVPELTGTVAPEDVQTVFGDIGAQLDAIADQNNLQPGSQPTS